MTKSRSNATAPAAKGELVIGTGTDASGILSVGANNTVLTADSSTSTGLKWAAPAKGGSMPSFSAYKNADQTITANVWTKISFQSERWDTDSCFDSTTNYRFTPTTAGKYLINVALRINQSSAGNGWWSFYKNGTLDRYIEGGALDTFQWTAGSCLMDFNGSTDYVECWVYITNGGTIPNGSTEYPTFDAAGVRI